MTLLFQLLSRLPLRLLHAAGFALGWIVFLCSARYRQRFGANAALAGYDFRQVRGAVGHAGRMAAELPRLWMGAPVHCEWINAECVDRAYAAGKGLVLLTPHLGCFEVAAQAIGRHYETRFGPFTVLYRPARQAWLTRIMEQARNRPGLRSAPTTLAGVRQMLRSLRSGQAVGLLPDQVPPEGMGVWAPFFGRQAYTMTLSARLVQQTGAAVVVGWAERLDAGRGFRLHFRELGQALADDPDLAAAQLNRVMEGLIRECPAQYLWSYARYKQPRSLSA